MFIPLSLGLFAIYTAAELIPPLLPGRANNAHSSCKAVPGTPSWPLVHEWAHLNQSVDGRLLRPSPPGAICHPEHASYNATACPALRVAWLTYDFHQADPVSVDWNQWTNDSCLPQEGAPCSGDGYPVFVLNATTARHVQQGVKFAKRHNVRLIVKSSGHDFLGRSNAPNSLSIWTHHLRGIKVHDSFRPRRCKSTVDTTTHAVTVGAGMQMWDLYNALDPLNRTIVGGGGKTVSVGGYLTGGGHSLLSSWYGLAADQVLEMEVVTPNGEIMIANECQNKDLFWAMRGGGGSTFGIMTSATMRTIPTPRLEHLTLTMFITNISDPGPIYEAAAYVLSKFPSMSDLGLTSYTFFFPPTLDPIGGTDTVFGGLITGGTLENSSPEDMHRLWDPVITHVKHTWPGVFDISYQPKAFPSSLAWFRENYDTTQAGFNNYMGSRLLDKAALTGNLTASADAYAQFVNGTIGIAHLVSGKGVHDARPRGGGNAVLPAWRKSYVHLTSGSRVPPLDQAAALAVRKGIQERVEALRKLAPNTGAYVNEANFEEPDFQREFWGSNYERLLSIKRTVDPDDVLWCTPCVGNERWQQVGGRLCRIEG